MATPFNKVQIPVGQFVTNTDFNETMTNELSTINSNLAAEVSLLNTNIMENILSVNTNMEPCFKSASITDQVITLTPVTGSPTNITLPSTSASNFNDNVGIGTTSPVVPLTIRKNNNYHTHNNVMALMTPNTLGTSGVVIGSINGNAPYISDFDGSPTGSTGLRIQQDGVDKIFLRENKPNNSNFNGEIRLSQNFNISYFELDNGGHHIDTYSTNGTGRPMYINYYANQGVILNRSFNISDDRVKEDEQFITNATETLLKLRPQTYTKYPSEISGNTIRPNYDMSGHFESGLIAQEIYYDAPELRHIVNIDDMSGTTIIPSSEDPAQDPDYSDWGNMEASVNYTELIPYLIKSNQELHERIKILENGEK